MDLILQKKQKERLIIISSYINKTSFNGKLVSPDKYFQVLMDYIEIRLTKYCKPDTKYHLDDGDVLDIVADCFYDLNKKYDKTKLIENYLNFIIRNKAKYYQAKKESAETGLSMNRIMKVLPDFKKNYEYINMKYPTESVANKLKMYSDKYSIKLSTVEGYFNDTYKRNLNISIDYSGNFDAYIAHSDNYFEQEQNQEQETNLEVISNCVMQSSENYWIDHKSTKYFSVLETCSIFEKVEDSFRGFYKQLMKLLSYSFIDSHSYDLFCKNEKLPLQIQIAKIFRKTTVSVDTKNFKNYLKNEIKLTKEVNNV